MGSFFVPISRLTLSGIFGILPAVNKYRASVLCRSEKRFVEQCCLKKWKEKQKMKTTKWLVGLIVVGIVMICSAARAQGNVTFTPINQATFNSYLGDAVWVALVDTRGNLTLYSNSVATASAGWSGDAMLNSSITVTESNGVVTLNTYIVNGSFGSQGESVTISSGSSAPIDGLVIGINSPVPGTYSGTADNWYINGLYGQSPVADTTLSNFGGMVASFSNQSSSFTSQFSFTQPNFGSGTLVSIVGYSVESTPEPNVLVICGVGGLFLLVLKRRRT